MKKYKVIDTYGNSFQLNEVVTDELEDMLLDSIYNSWIEYNRLPDNKHRIFIGLESKIAQYMYDYQVKLISPKLNNNITIL